MNFDRPPAPAQPDAAPVLAELIRELLADSVAVSIPRRQAWARSLSAMIAVAVLSVTGALVVAYRTQAWVWVLFATANTGSLIYTASLWLSIQSWTTHRDEMITQVKGLAGLQPPADDGRVGRKVHRLEIKLYRGDTFERGMFIELPPMTDEQYEQLVAGLQTGRPLSRAEWCGQNGKPKVFTQGEFRTLQDEMIRRELAAPEDPKQANSPVILTDIGRATIAALASELPGGGG